MNLPLLEEVIRFLLDVVAPFAGSVCLFFAGWSFYRAGAQIADEGLTGWIFWAILCFTLPLSVQMVLGFFGQSLAFSSGGEWNVTALGTLVKSIAAFKTFLLVYVAGALAGFLLLKAVLDLSYGRNPLVPVMGFMFLLTLSSTEAFLTLLASSSSKADYPLYATLKGLWRYIAGTIMPVGAAFAIIGMIINYNLNKPVVHLVFSALGFLTVFGLDSLLRHLIQ